MVSYYRWKCGGAKHKQAVIPLNPLRISKMAEPTLSWIIVTVGKRKRYNCTKSSLASDSCRLLSCCCFYLCKGCFNLHGLQSSPRTGLRSPTKDIWILFKLLCICTTFPQWMFRLPVRFRKCYFKGREPGSSLPYLLLFASRSLALQSTHTHTQGRWNVYPVG